MTPHFINLNCTNCGAKLDVHDDMERFASGYCGTEMIVQRRGGTVALKALTAAIIKVQTGTDKTAAELALARYEKEIAALGISLEDAELRGRPSASAVGICVLVCLILWAGVAAAAALTMAVIFTALFVFLDNLANNDAKPILVAIEELKKKIAEARRIADS